MNTTKANVPNAEVSPSAKGTARNLRVMISGGGTGGHIFPAVAIANATGAILLGGVASEEALARLRFYPDGTCDRVRLDITRNENRTIVPIDPLTCAPLPAIDAK